jgi:hypothetical protein
MKAWTGSRFIRPVAIGLAVGAILAPGAQAQDQPYGELYQRHSVTPYGELYQHASVAPYAPLYQYQFQLDGTPVSPLLTEPESTAVPVSETPAAYGELYQNPSAGLVTPTASGGMDWTDAGIGAGIALGVLVVAAAGALAVRRRGLAHS